MTTLARREANRIRNWQAEVQEHNHHFKHLSARTQEYADFLLASHKLLSEAEAKGNHMLLKVIANAAPLSALSWLKQHFKYVYNDALVEELSFTEAEFVARTLRENASFANRWGATVAIEDGKLSIKTENEARCFTLFE